MHCTSAASASTTPLLPAVLQATGRGAAVLRVSGGGRDGGGGGGRGWVGNGTAVDACCAGWAGLGQDPGHGGAG